MVTDGELLIMRPTAPSRTYGAFIAAFVDAAVSFPWDDDYSLPETLPADLADYRCVVMDPARLAALEGEAATAALLDDFRRAGGFVYVPDLALPASGAIGDVFARHYVHRAVCTAGLTLRHPAMLARLQGADEDALVAHWLTAPPDELRQYEAMENYFCDPVGYVTFRACDAAADYFERPELRQPMWDYIAAHADAFDPASAREITGGRHAIACAAACDRPDILERVLHYLRRPQLWRVDGVAINRDLRVPPGCDRDQPPARVLDNAWTWPENAAVIGDTFVSLSVATGDPRWTEDALRHILGAWHWLYDPQRQLIMHIGRPSGPDPRATPWGRGMAWFLFALRGMLEDLPPDHPERPALISMLRPCLDGLIRCQRDDGLWSNVLDAGPRESRACSSATVRIIQFYASAYARGWLRDERIPAVLERAWLGLKTKIWDFGLVAYCVGTSYSLDRQVYLARPHDTFRSSRSNLLLAWIELQRMRAARG